MKRLAKKVPDLFLIHKHHNVPIFDVGVHLIVTDNVVRAAKAMARLIGDEFTLGEEDKEVHGMVMASGSEYVVFFNKDSVARDIIAHELSHLATDIMKYRSIKDDEVRSLLIGYFIHVTYDFLEKKKIRVKKREAVS